MTSPRRLGLMLAVIGLVAASVVASAPSAQAGFDIDATLTLSKYSGYPLDRVKVTYRIATPPIGGCWFKVGIDWDDVTWGQSLEFPSDDNCTATVTFTVFLVKPYSNVGKHKVCATPTDIYGPRGPTICRTFTIKARVQATPKPTPAPSPSPTSTPTPTLEPTTTPAPTPSIPAVPLPTPTATAPDETANPDAVPASTGGPSVLGFVVGALVGGLVVVLIGARMLRRSRDAPQG